MKKILLNIALGASIALGSCEDFVTQEPITGIAPETVIIDGESAETAVLGVYSGIQGGGMYGLSLIADPGVLSDEMTHSGSFPTIAEMDNNNINSRNVTTDNTWAAGFSVLFRANNIIEILDSETEFSSFPAADRARILAEARFGRALTLFQLANAYGDVPLATTTELAVLELIERSPQAEVYAFVISEAEAAAAALDGVSFGTELETQARASKWAAKALQARANLYAGNLAAAGALANEIIESGEFSLASSYATLFGPGPVVNDEIIFSVAYNANDQNGMPFQFLPAGRFEYAVGSDLVGAYAVGTDDEDGRAATIVFNDADPLSRYYVNKYQDLNNGTDGVIAFRLAEMYLIRAEANLQSNPAAALADINVLRTRAGVAELGAITLDDILNERFMELAFEGHRWFDLRRTGKLVEVMSGINSDFVINDQFLPIPQTDRDLNPNLTQNPGY